MKTRKTFSGIIVIVIIAIMACSNGSTDENPNKVYGIPVTGDVTQARVNTIKAAIDMLATYPSGAAKAAKIKTATEFQIVASGGISVTGKVIKIDTIELDHVNAIANIADAFETIVDSNQLTFLQIQNVIRLAMETDKKNDVRANVI